MVFPGGSDGKESACLCRRPGFNPWVGKIPWRRAWQPTPGFLPGESHGQRSPVVYSPWGCKDLDMTEATSHAYTYVSTCVYIAIREGDGTPLQYSCLENPRDRGAWWAAVYGVAQSRTRLKRLSNSSSSILQYICMCNIHIFPYNDFIH